MIARARHATMRELAPRHGLTPCPLSDPLGSSGSAPRGSHASSRLPISLSRFRQPVRCGRGAGAATPRHGSMAARSQRRSNRQQRSAKQRGKCWRLTRWSVPCRAFLPLPRMALNHFGAGVSTLAEPLPVTIDWCSMPAAAMPRKQPGPSVTRMRSGSTNRSAQATTSSVLRKPSKRPWEGRSGALVVLGDGDDQGGRVGRAASQGLPAALPAPVGAENPGRTTGQGGRRQTTDIPGRIGPADRPGLG